MTISLGVAAMTPEDALESLLIAPTRRSTAPSSPADCVAQ
jgi:hypothetical protein